MSALLESVAVLTLVLVVPGWATARALGIDADFFARVWLGLGVTSIVALQLATSGVFSLPVLLAVLAAFTVVCVVLGWLRARLAGSRRTALVTPTAVAHVSTVRTLAFLAGLVAFFSCWPPFETVIAASDSTMYVNAGIHLARTGTLRVTDSVLPHIPPATARMIFPSVRPNWFGPIIRLPGGLLMADLLGHEASPAFFPLLSVWAGILAAAGGAAAAPAIAPVLTGLAVWAVVLFAGEIVGLVAAAATAVLLVANFAFWWFGRFAVAEPLTCAFLWGGLVVLGRALMERHVGSALVAGALMGLAGLARTETFLFVGAAGVLWSLYARVAARLGIAAVVGFAAVLAFTASVVRGMPSHHLAYLMSDAGLQYLALLPHVAEAWRNGTLVIAGVLAAAAVLVAGIVGHRRHSGFVGPAFGTLAMLALAASLPLYARLAGGVHPWQHLGWLAAYCSWLLVALAPLGGVVVWRRGPAARLAVVLAVLVTIVFIVNPRVQPFQPWAIRRFLPIVIPALTVAAAAVIARLAERRRWWLSGVAIATVLTIAVIEVRPILAARPRPYFMGSIASVERLAGRFPPNAIVVIESSFANLQFQVPLWLMFGRETMMMPGNARVWGEVMRGLTMSGRPVYWVDNLYAAAPTALGLVVHGEPPDLEIQVPLPDGPADVPPSLTVNRLALLRIYRVDSATP